MPAEESILARRLAVKNDSFTFINNLKDRYAMSVAEAESLDKEVRLFFNDSAYLEDGQEFYTAIHISEPAGKPLKNCKSQRITLTLRCKEDLRIRAAYGIKAFFKITISRICWQALKQDALLTQEDIAFLINLSRASVKRLLSELKKDGHYIPTRGNYHDIGPGTSHKFETLKLYIKGMEPTDIALRLGHALNSIERYIEDFALVVCAALEDYSSLSIARFTGLSEKLVKEYLILFDRYSMDDKLKPFLDQVIEDFKHRKLVKKTDTKRTTT
jgi:biotin operon repressor